MERKDNIRINIDKMNKKNNLIWMKKLIIAIKLTTMITKNNNN